jgi:hypothetical protein
LLIERILALWYNYIRKFLRGIIMVYNGKIPTDRVIDKLDDYLSKKDFDSAKRYLNYWLT